MSLRDPTETSLLSLLKGAKVSILELAKLQLDLTLFHTILGSLRDPMRRVLKSRFDLRQWDLRRSGYMLDPLRITPYIEGST